MRKACLGCVLKHLGAAAVIEEEIRNGYPSYAFLLYGHMDQASAESWSVNKTLAKVIRQHRVNFQYKQDYDIPFEALAEFVTILTTMEDSGENIETLRSVVPTKECLIGIQKDEKGNPVFDGDTRP